MTAQSSPADLEAAQVLLAMSSSSRSDLGGTRSQLAASAPAAVATRACRRFPVDRPLSRRDVRQATLVRVDLEQYQHGLAKKGSDQQKEPDFSKFLGILRFLVDDYAPAIKKCDRPALSELFIKVNCIATENGWGNKRAPDAKIWCNHMDTIYSAQVVLTLWDMIHSYLDAEVWHLENLELDLAAAVESRKAHKARKMRHARNSLESAPRDTLYMLRCMWWWFREQTPVSAASFQCQ